MKRAIGFLLSLIILISLSAVTAFAEDSACVQNTRTGKTYSSIMTAFDEAQNGDTIKIIKSFVSQQSANVNNGKHIILDTNKNIVVFEGTLPGMIVNDGSLDIIGEGQVKGQSVFGTVRVHGTSEKNKSKSSLYLAKNTGIVALNSFCVAIGNPGENDSSLGVNVTIDGNLIVDTKDTFQACVALWGINDSSASNVPQITLNNTSSLGQTSDDDNTVIGIYAVGYGKWNLNGSIDSVGLCVYAERGDLTINKGIYQCIHDSILLTCTEAAPKRLFLSIKDGDFVSTQGKCINDAPKGAVLSTNNESADKYSELYIAGGSFVSSDDAIWSSNNKKFISGGKFSSDVSAYVVKDKSCEYSSSEKYAKYIVGEKHICPSSKFIDVPKQGESWYHDAIDYVLEKGYMAGVSTNKFDPNNSVTRATIAQILYAMESKPEINGNRFSDVPKEKWYTNSVNWCASEGIVAGYGNGIFKPNQAITRQELVAILYKYAQYKKYDTSVTGSIDSFADSKHASNYAIPALKWALGHNIMSGNGRGLDPKGPANRAQVAVMLKAFDENIKYSYERQK